MGYLPQHYLASYYLVLNLHPVTHLEVFHKIESLSIVSFGVVELLLPEVAEGHTLEKSSTEVKILKFSDFRLHCMFFLKYFGSKIEVTFNLGELADQRTVVGRIPLVLRVQRAVLVSVQFKCRCVETNLHQPFLICRGNKQTG